MKIFELFGSILIENDGANESLDKTDSKARKIVESLGKGIKSAAKWGGAILGGAAIAGGAMLKAGDKFAETTDRIDKMSQSMGLSRKGFQEWDFIASQSGASVEELQGGFTSLAKKLTEAKEGAGGAADAFAKLQLDPKDYETQEQAMAAVVSAMQSMEEGAEKAALADELLGGAGEKLMPLLNGQAGSMEEMAKQANELGLVMGDDVVDAGVKYADTMDQIKRSIGAMGTKLMSGLMPILQNFLDLVMSNMPMIQGMLENVFSGFGAAMQVVMPVLLNIVTTILPVLIELFTQIATTILPIVISLFTTIATEILPVLIELFTTVITAILPALMEILTVIIEQVLPPLIELFMIFIDLILPPMIELFNILIEQVLPPFMELFTFLIENILPILIEIFTEIMTKILPPFIDLIMLIAEKVMPPLLDIFMMLAEAVLPVVMVVFEALLKVVGPVMDAISAVIRTVLALIKGDWEGVWQGIQDFFDAYIEYVMVAVEGFAEIFKAVFQGIADIVAGIWDGMVNGIKSGINFIIEGINAFIRGLNKLKIPDWVPKVGGNGINLSEIPLLAEGGDIVSAGRVIVGDAGPEYLDLPKGARVTPLKNVANDTQAANVAGMQLILKVEKAEIREEADIKKVAKELFNMIKRDKRAKGVLV